jgi:phospholipase/carboxylesterase
MVEPERAQIGGELVCRIRRPDDPAERGVILLHGLGGDENVMWVFGGVLPPAWAAVAPRAAFPATDGGWSWTQTGKEHLASVDELGESVGRVRGLLESLQAGLGVPQDGWVWVGFSQGAGLAFAAACAPGVRPRAVVSLAGFVPDGFEARAGARLAGLPVYWGHGTKDDQVPVERARRDVSRLREAGLDVTYCEADVGHKLGADCLRGLKEWFSGSSARQGSPDDS